MVWSNQVDWSCIFGDDLEEIWNNFKCIVFNYMLRGLLVSFLHGPIALAYRIPPSYQQTPFQRIDNFGRPIQPIQTTALNVIYSACARLCRIIIIKHVADIANKIVQSNKIGKFYKYTQIQNYPVSLVFSVIKTEDGNVTFDQHEPASYFNDIFASVDNNVDNSATPPIDSHANDHVFKILKK